MSEPVTQFDPNTDPYSNREIYRDIGALVVASQVLGPKDPLHHLHSEEIQKEKCSQLSRGLGLRNPGFYLTTLGFLYLGGLFQARRQFISGADYFVSAKFDFVGGKKPIMMGLLFGMTFGSFLFGNPYLVEDFIRGKFRLLRSNRDERFIVKPRDGYEFQTSRTEIKTIFD